MEIQFKKIRPKLHHCYQDCFRILEKNHKLIPNLLLVHGFPAFQQGPQKGKRFGHAWIEYRPTKRHKPLVIEALYQERHVAQWIYYSLGNINPEECLYYTYEEALLLANSTENYGPWVKTPRHIRFHSVKKERP